MKSDISENIALYDWVTISCKAEDPKLLMGLLGLKGVSWETRSKGMNGYKQGFTCNNITVLYEGNEGMGTCLNMSGQGCRAFEEYGTGDYEGLFQLVKDDPEFFHLTRLDVAFDDHTGILDIERLFHDCDHIEYVSKFRTAEIYKKFKDEQPGITVAHGSKKSAIYLRIYDKAAERGYTDGRHWIRVEMQLRDERAFAFLTSPESFGLRMKGVLLNYVRYVDESPGDANRWRWPMKAYWADLIGEAEKIKLYTKPGAEYNILQLDNFVFHQAGNAIQAAMQIYGTPGFISKMKEQQLISNAKYEKLVEQYRKKRGKGV